jgi:hypothetical protein
LTSTINLTGIHSSLKDHVKEEYASLSTHNGTGITIKEMTKYSAMKPYLGKSNVLYFTFFTGSGNTIKAVICHLPLDTEWKIYPTALGTWASKSST